jgi:D-xylose transport system substrate-binding protein
MRRHANLSWGFVLVLGILLGACSGQPPAERPPTAAAPAAPVSPAPGGTEKKAIKIGFSMDTLKEDRWQRDRDLFVERAKELGAEVLVQSANGNDSLQNAQAESLLAQGVDVLVVVPHNLKTTAQIVDKAHRANVKVIAYDRIIRDCDLDLYVSFDNYRVGELQAQELVKRVPQGNYVLIGGAPTDNNALMLREGQLAVLKPYMDRGDIKIVADQWAKDWEAVEAQKHVENALTKTKNDVQAVVASNDGTAAGAIQALSKQNLAGKVAVSGQDADLSACQRIAEGTQTMTVYKPIDRIARTAAEAAVKMVRGEPIDALANKKINNGKTDVPSILLEPIPVTKDNLYQAIVKNRFHPVEEVYKNLPREQWPGPN